MAVPQEALLFPRVLDTEEVIDTLPADWVTSKLSIEKLLSAQNNFPHSSQM
jgi:hypothetical protein